MTRQKLNSFRSNQIEVSYLVLVSKSKEMCRKFPEIRSLSYFKRINGLEFWCLQIPLKVVTFWDEPKLAKSCPANFVPLKKFRVQNNEHVTPSVLASKKIEGCFSVWLRRYGNAVCVVQVVATCGRDHWACGWVSGHMKGFVSWCDHGERMQQYCAPWSRWCDWRRERNCCSLILFCARMP